MTDVPVLPEDLRQMILEILAYEDKYKEEIVNEDAEQIPLEEDYIISDSEETNRKP